MELFKKRYKVIIKSFLTIYYTLRDEGKFIWLAMYEELGLEF